MDHKRLTTNQGVPVGDNQNSRTAGSRGPTLLEDYHLIEKIAHFDREPGSGTGCPCPWSRSTWDF